MSFIEITEWLRQKSLFVKLMKLSKIVFNAASDAFGAKDFFFSESFKRTLDRAAWDVRKDIFGFGNGNGAELFNITQNIHFVLTNAARSVGMEGGGEKSDLGA